MSVQIGLVASQFSLPMLAPLLFGTGILLRSIRTNASLIFPRIGVVVVLLWMLWFFNSVVQNTVVYLRRQVGPLNCREQVSKSRHLRMQRFPMEMTPE